MKTLKEIIAPNYFNEKLAQEFDRESLRDENKNSKPSPILEFLRTKIFRADGNNFCRSLLGEPRIESIADIDFTITPEKFATLQPMLKNLNLNYSALSFEDYLKIGEGFVNFLEFESARLSTEDVRAYMHVTKDQLATFSYSNLQALGLGNLGEIAMRKILKKQGVNGKKFKSRGFLFYNLDTPQEEKDMEVFIKDKITHTERVSTLGVRAQEDFERGYLYPKKRCATPNSSKIAEQVVFLHNFGYHIFYITGIVEKDFLFKPVVNTTRSPMEEFVFPEYANLLNFNRNENNVRRFCESYGLHPKTEAETSDYIFSDEEKAKIQQKFAKRISFKDLMGKLVGR